MGVGVYFCTCGGVISQQVDAQEACAGISEIPGVSYTETIEFMCAEEGKDAFRQSLHLRKPARVVVAACSPREHEGTFRGVMASAGINPYCMQMANIREQVSWVTPDARQALAKAVSVIRGAVSRVQLHEELVRESFEVCCDVLVVGAGPAGLKAALSLAKAGRHVTLVEKGPVIGGMPVRMESVFPGMECGSCMVEPILDDVLHGPDAASITLLTLADVVDVAGYFGNFLVKIKTRPRYVSSMDCIGCGECVPVCPVSEGNPFNYGMNQRHAIDFPFAGALPNLPLINMNACVRSKGENCDKCQLACPVPGAILFSDCGQSLEIKVGAIVLAIGSTIEDCSIFPNLGYGWVAGLFTSYEFERMLAHNGPTGGEIRLSHGRPPESVVLIHCVGSMDPNHRDYCSETCCQNAFKFNQKIHELLPETEIIHLYREIVAPGKDGYAFVRRGMQAPHTRTLRYHRIDDLHVTRGGEKLEIRVRGEDGSIGEVKTDIRTDMVVLCPATIPSEDHPRLGEMMDVVCDRYGFFSELHNRADAVQSRIKGIYLAGSCQAPMDLKQSMSQGVAVAGHVLSELVDGRTITMEPITASVLGGRCSGCVTCLSVCPFKAIHRREDGEVWINRVLCVGCGTCVAACPGGAIKGNHFTFEAILAEIDGVLA